MRVPKGNKEEKVGAQRKQPKIMPKGNKEEKVGAQRKLPRIMLNEERSMQR